MSLIPNKGNGRICCLIISSSSTGTRGSESFIDPSRLLWWQRAPAGSTLPGPRLRHACPSCPTWCVCSMEPYRSSLCKYFLIARIALIPDTLASFPMYVCPGYFPLFQMAAGRSCRLLVSPGLQRRAGASKAGFVRAPKARDAAVINAF